MVRLRSPQAPGMTSYFIRHPREGEGLFYSASDFLNLFTTSGTMSMTFDMSELSLLMGIMRTSSPLMTRKATGSTEAPPPEADVSPLDW